MIPTALILGVAPPALTGPTIPAQGNALGGRGVGRSDASGRMPNIRLRLPSRVARETRSAIHATARCTRSAANSSASPSSLLTALAAFVKIRPTVS